VKTTRHIAIADHLWVALERMAEELGADRDALVNQALHAFARWNGYVVPGAPDADALPPLPPPPALAAASPGAVPPPLAPALRRGGEAEQVIAAAARLERAIDAPAPAPGAAAAPVPPLAILREDGSLLAVAKDRFVIGRGRHCDLVIDSPKVSREHAAIVREDGGWSIEDLGSSNGTWHLRERVGKRRIADGDEFFVCSEKLRCVLR
jgi:FHA domain-containing protein